MDKREREEKSLDKKTHKSHKQCQGLKGGKSVNIRNPITAEFNGGKRRQTKDNL